MSTETERSAGSGPVSATWAHAENSDVLPVPNPSVAVAVTKLPTLTMPRPSAVNGIAVGADAAGSAIEPIGAAPSPKPPGDGALSQRDTE